MMDAGLTGVDVTGYCKAGLFQVGLGGLLEYLNRLCVRVFG